MGPLVRKIDGVWTEWTGHNEPMPNGAGDLVTLTASALGGWAAEDLAEFGLVRAVPFEVPEGKVAVGEPRYIEDNDTVRQVFDVEDEPGPTVDELKDLAAALRWQKETGGITVDSSTVDTSRESQAMINGAYNLAMDDPDVIIRFKSPSGFVTLDAATMIVIGRAVGRHVQSCFAKESYVVGAIDAGLITTYDQVKAEFT